MLLGSVHDRAHALGDAQILNLEIKSHSRIALVAHGRPILFVAVSLVAHRPIVGSHLHSVAAQSLRVDWFLGAVHERVFPMALVIDGNMPVDGIPSHRVTSTAEGS